MSKIGNKLQLHIYGGSHERVIGMTLSGVKAGLKVDEAALQAFLDRRAPGRSPWSTARKEADKTEFISGIENGITDGNTVEAIIRNCDTRTADYTPLENRPRPGHADYTAFVKYGACVPGGGQFSGRLTAPMCIAGGLCKQWLEAMGIFIGGHILRVADIEDRRFDPLTPQLADIDPLFPTLDGEAGAKMRDLITRTKAEGDSVGGSIECAVTGLPAGLGGPLFDGLEGRLSQYIFAIPAVKGLRFGEILPFGSRNNDAFTVENGSIRTLTNHCGGILGGISNGMSLLFTAEFKPTPSIALPQQSVDLRTKECVSITAGGRHDPCILPRAVPVVEAAAALALYDMILEGAL